tara:strand:- start:2308 stop:2553 length:246 start_codon:yes stop_codon:yes gene_type:complete
MSNPFTRRGTEPNYTTENFSVKDVKASNARFYEKFPDAVEPAAMIKKAMQNPDDEVVKQQTRREEEEKDFMKKIKITGGIY